MSSLVMGLVVAILAFLLLAEAADLPERARQFPTALLWGLGLVGVLLALQGAVALWRNKRHATDRPVPEAPVEARIGRDLVYQVVIPGALLIGTYGLLTVVGFYFAVPVLMAGLYLYHTYLSEAGHLGRGQYVRSVVFAVSTTIVMYVVFDVLIGLPAPSGAFM